MCLFAEHAVVGPLVVQPLQDHRVGPFVARRTQRPPVVEPELVAHDKQQLAGVLGEFGGQRRVGQGHACQARTPATE